MRSNRLPVSIIFAGRAIYALNWYNVSPIYPLLTDRFPAQSQYLWLMFALFLVGAGIFQVPAGIIASRIGSRKTALLGLLLMGISVSMIYLAPNLYFIIALRFVTGVSAAFFFSSGVSVLGYLQPEKVSRNVAYYNGYFAFGAGIGILPFTFLINSVGWRVAISLGGLATIIIAALALDVVPEGNDKSEVDTKYISKKLKDGYIWVVSAGMGGYYALNFTIGEYFKPYIQSLGFSGNIASVVASLTLFCGLVGALMIGYFARSNPIRQIVSIIVFLSLIDTLLVFANLYLFVIIAIANGVLSIILFSKEYLVVMLYEKDRSMVALDLGLLNSIQLTIGGGLSAVYGLSLGDFGYQASWLILSLISLSTLPLFAFAFKRIKSSGAAPVGTNQVT